MPNDHYVTESLTKHWQDGPYLWYFDFADRQVDRKPSSILFAKEGLNPPAVEAALNKYIETPLTKFRAKFLRTNSLKPNTISYCMVPDWWVFRALVLFPLVQNNRIMHLRNPQAGHLENFFAAGEHGLDQEVQKVREGYRVVALSLSDEAWLFYPEIGFFQFSVSLSPDSQHGPFGVGVAVPLTPWLALALIPKDADLVLLEKHKDQLRSWSVGLDDQCRRIVFPAVLPEHRAEVAAEIMRMRKAIVQIEAVRDFWWRFSQGLS
jgi:hypothetical protein